MQRLAQKRLRSVAQPERAGGSSTPFGLKSMQNTLFLALLRPIFALKTKIAPPTVLAMRVGEEPDVISSRKVGFSLDEDLFFGDHLNLNRKTDSI